MWRITQVIRDSVVRLQVGSRLPDLVASCQLAPIFDAIGGLTPMRPEDKDPGNVVMHWPAAMAERPGPGISYDERGRRWLSSSPGSAAATSSPPGPACWPGSA